MCFFFFQAEDGIRDYKVTGVQTCALPILPYLPRAGRRRQHFRSGADRILEAPELRAIHRGRGERQAGGEYGEIGRASCRERGLSTVGAGAQKKKERDKMRGEAGGRRVEQR